MDPNETLAQLRALAAADLYAGNRDAERLAELFIALDQWLAKGGFLPADWNKRR